MVSRTILVPYVLSALGCTWVVEQPGSSLRGPYLVMLYGVHCCSPGQLAHPRLSRHTAAQPCHAFPSQDR
eukprot:7735149-Alexandrium_andersonii.AAC.1